MSDRLSCNYRATKGYRAPGQTEVGVSTKGLAPGWAAIGPRMLEWRFESGTLNTGIYTQSLPGRGHLNYSRRVQLFGPKWKLPRFEIAFVLVRF
jgi:hypothetical protein